MRKQEAGVCVVLRFLLLPMLSKIHSMNINYVLEKEKSIKCYFKGKMCSSR